MTSPQRTEQTGFCQNVIYRDQRMRRMRTREIMVAVALGVLFLHLCNYFSDQKSIWLPNNERKVEENHIWQPNKNSTYIFAWSACQQNKFSANTTDFNYLPEHIQNFLYYRHCRHFSMLLDVPDKCGGADKSADVFLLLVIKSSPRNYERREVLRKTWAKERLHNGKKIHRVFITGTTDISFETVRQNKLLQLEHHEYNDILQWDFVDTFFNLTLKQILFLEWMGKNCPNARFLLNGDDDVFANTDNMVEYLQSLKDNDGSKHLFVGHLIQNVGPIRLNGNKYFIPVQVYVPESYPPYCGGAGFLLSSYTAMVIYNVSQYITIFPIDDVYMGMCLAKAGLSPVSHMGVKTAGINIPSSKVDDYDPCYYKDMLLVHRFIPGTTYLLWQKVHDPDLKCENTLVS